MAVANQETALRPDNKQPERNTIIAQVTIGMGLYPLSPISSRREAARSTPELLAKPK